MEIIYLESNNIGNKMLNPAATNYNRAKSLCMDHKIQGNIKTSLRRFTKDGSTSKL